MQSLLATHPDTGIALASQHTGYMTPHKAQQKPGDLDTYLTRIQTATQLWIVVPGRLRFKEFPATF